MLVYDDIEFAHNTLVEPLPQNDVNDLRMKLLQNLGSACWHGWLVLWGSIEQAMPELSNGKENRGTRGTAHSSCESPLYTISSPLDISARKLLSSVFLGGGGCKELLVFIFILMCFILLCQLCTGTDEASALIHALCRPRELCPLHCKIWSMCACRWIVCQSRST